MSTVESDGRPDNLSGSPDDVAERFRYFLQAIGLTREQFVAEVDGAIGARSLYAVLSGARRPSRALAVLIERTWGFRADFLLTGDGPIWKEPSVAAAGELSPEERDVIAFMRRSVETARTVRAEVERAELWERLFARTMRLLRELERLGRSQDTGDLATYPVLIKLVHDESLFLAARFHELAELRHRLHVHRLSDAFIRRFVEQIPRRLLDERQQAHVRELLASVQGRRRDHAAGLEEAVAGLHAALERIAASEDLPTGASVERWDAHRAHAHRAALTRLRAVLADGAPPEVRSALDAVEQTAPPPPTFWERFRELVERLVQDLEPGPSHVPARTAEELEDLHRRIVAPLAG